MDFELTDDQIAIRDMVRDLARNEVAPHAADWDERQHFPRELFAKLGELGLLGVIIPEEYGGAGLGYVEYELVLEELGAADGGVGLSVAAHNSLCTNHLYQFGSEELKREFVPKLASGEWIGAWGLTEPEAGSDAGGTRTTAVLDGGEWVLNGSKNFITHATVGNCCVVMARTSREGGHHGISAFFVPFDRDRRVAGQEGEQARHALLRHLVAGARGLPRAGGLPARWGGRRLRAGDEDPRRRPDLDRGAVGGHRPRRSRRRGRVLDRARAVRSPAELVPGDPPQARRHGDPGRRGAAAHLAGGGDEGPRSADHARVVDGQGLRLRGGGQGRRGGDPDPRRLRLHQGLPGRAAVARRQAVHHRRGHLARSSAW